MNTVGKPESLIQAPLMERMLAAIIDLIIAGGFCFFPRIGWIIGLLYHLTRDSLPFLNGQSFGKYLMRLQVITVPQQESLVNKPDKSFIRGVVMLIPILNIIDVWYLFAKGYRLADKWAETAVVPYSESETEN